MVTLYGTTEKIRNVFKWGAILIAIIVVVVIIFKVGMIIKEMISPTLPPPPTVTFGKLPNIVFPQSNVVSSFTYTVDTLSGSLPIFPDRTNVYKIIAPLQATLLSSKEAQEKVSKIGFISEGVPLSETLFQWEIKSPSYKKLVLDVASYNFKLSSDFLTNPEFSEINNSIDEKNAISEAKSFISNINQFPTDIDSLKTKTTRMLIKNSKLTQAEDNFSNAVRVDFYQNDQVSLKPKDLLPVYYPQFPRSSMSILVASGKIDTQVVEADFFHNDISNDFATYPIKTGDMAFSELKEGKGYIVSYYGTNNNISIKNIFLAYYMDNKTQEYLPPIIVFEGNDGFLAYIQAITDEWINR